MNEFSFVLQRASLFGLAALAIALGLQWVLADRVPASWRVWVWRVALLQSALALVPLAPVAIAILPARAPVAPVATPIVPAPSVEAPISSAPLPVEAPTVAAMESVPPIVSPPLETPAPSSAPESEADYLQIQLSWRELMVWIYAFGIAVQLLLLASHARRVRRVLRVCTPIENARLNVIAARLDIARVPRLLQSDGGSPFLTGIWRPTIVLPQTLDAAYLDAILAHELAHFKRRDLAWNALLWIAQTLLWFHPLAFAARRFHALEVESACDELTLQLTRIAPKSYGALLIHSMDKHNLPLTAGVSDGFFALQTRLKRLGRTPKSPRKSARWLFGAALLLSFVAVLPIEFRARAQSIVGELAANSAPVTGIVVNPNGEPLANARISVEGLDTPGDIGPRGAVRSDARGRFVVPAALLARPAQLFASHGDRDSDYGEIVKGGDDVTLTLFQKVGVTIEGQTRETKSQRPLEGIEVALYRRVGGKNIEVATTRSNAQGAFRLTGARPYQNYLLSYKSPNYHRSSSFIGPSFSVKRGMTYEFGASMDATQSALRGQLLRADGTPAPGYGIEVWDGTRVRGEVVTRPDGKFFFANLKQGRVILHVREPGATKARFFTTVTTDNPNLVTVAWNQLQKIAAQPSLTMTLIGRGSMLYHGNKASEPSKTAALAGQIAPALRVRAESNAPSLQTLRGRVVLLYFGDSDGLSPTIANLARTHGKRGLRVLNVRNLPIMADEIEIVGGKPQSYKGLVPRVEVAARQLKIAAREKSEYKLPIDVAFDLPRSAAPNSGGQSAALYGNAPYAVIARDGTVAYVGDKIERVVTAVLDAIGSASATLSGQVKLPSGAGTSAIVMVRPAADAGFASAIEKPTDARGRYSIAGLKPGRYKVTALLDDDAKTKWAAPSLNQSLAPGANRADFPLTRGALIEGMVWTQSTRRPIAGVEVLTADPDGDGTIVKTDVKGHFEFRVTPGPVAVRVHGAPPPESSPTPTGEFRFNAQNGQRFYALFELPEAARN